MDIYIIDDKKEELERAGKAIATMGHKRITKTFNLWGMETQSPIVFWNEYYNNKELGIFRPENIMHPLDEILFAVQAAKECGGGIITDLMFRIVNLNKTVPPSGLLVILHAVAAGVPVVVCTSTSNHHSESLSWIFDGYVVPARNRESLLFGWIENKDWDAAVKLLERLHAQQQKKEVTK